MNPYNATQVQCTPIVGPVWPANGTAEDSPANRPWYVVHTKAFQESLAAENLVRQGYAVYLPQLKRFKRIRGRQQEILEPMFPRYLFIQPESLHHSIAPVRSTLGVSSLIRFGQQLAIMRGETLECIRNLELHHNKAMEAEFSPFRRGEYIEVADGPLSGFKGLISDIRQERVVVLLHLLGQETRVNMSHHQLVVAKQ